VQQGGTASQPCPWQFICQGFFLSVACLFRMLMSHAFI